MAAAPAAAQMLCGPRGDVAANLEKGYAERPVSMGLASNGAVVEVFASEAGTFTIVVTRPNGLSCLVAAGDEWQNLPAKPLEPSAMKIKRGTRDGIEQEWIEYDIIQATAEDTTWRPGNTILYGYGCLSANAMEDVAEGRVDSRDAVRREDCFVIQRAGDFERIPAQLLEWVSGPHDGGSIWRARDIQDDIVYVWLDDATGPHPPTHEEET